MSLTKFRQIYIEITNICNLNCSFCPGTERNPDTMSTENFSRIIKQIAPIAEKVYLHVMGEPTLHPELDKIIILCANENIPVDLTLNGTNLTGFEERLLHPVIRQINISIHAAEQFSVEDKFDYLEKIFIFTKNAFEIRPDLYINYRIWNLDNSLSINHYNNDIIEKIEQFFNLEIPRAKHTIKNKGINLTNRLFLHFDTKFYWPESGKGSPRLRGYCHGLSKQIAILVDGTVVPCCLDRNGVTNLGNCLETDINSIINGTRAKNIFNNFKNRKIVEKLCQHCQYSNRFK